MEYLLAFICAAAAAWFLFDAATDAYAGALHKERGFTTLSERRLFACVLKLTAAWVLAVAAGVIAS